MRLALIAGTTSLALAEDVADELGATTQPCQIERFPDGEMRATVSDVRDADVYVLQGTAPPVSDGLLELLMVADAARRGGAARVTAVIPYLGYARQDRRDAEGQSLGASVIAGLLSPPFDRLVVVDLHSAALEGFFACPVDDLSAVPLLAERVRPLVRGAVVVAPDLGAAKRAQHFGRLLGLDVAGVRKRRLSGHEVEALGVDGDVRGRDVLIVDDMISTGATIVAAAQALRAAGALRVTVAATHGLLVASAAPRLSALGLEAILITDSIPVRARTTPPLTVVGLAPLVAEAVGRLHGEAPLPELVAQW